MHEHLDEMGLVHMNGRIYDPLIGRFMSADPIIQAPGMLQSYNRYAYVMNNPLNLTDPSGFSWWTRFRDKWVRPIAIAVIAYYTGGAISGAFASASGGATTAFGSWAAAAGGGTTFQLSALGGALAGAGGGFVAGGLGTGNLQGALQGAFSGAVFGGIGGAGGSSGWSTGQYVAAHAAGGCITSVAGGGACGSGAASAAFGKFTTIQTQDWGFGIAQGAAAVVAGGVGSVIAGGKFENGATTAAFGYLFNAGLSIALRGGVFLVGAVSSQWDNIKTGWNALTKGLGSVMMSEGGADGGDQSGNANPRAPSKGTKEAADAEATDENGKLRCQYCGTELTKEPGKSNSREFDHFDPYKNGGSNTIDNILGACRTCNRGKGSKSYPDEWQPK
jgi:RHS repeat-associated protein